MLVLELTECTLYLLLVMICKSDRTTDYNEIGYNIVTSQFDTGFISSLCLDQDTDWSYMVILMCNVAQIYQVKCSIEALAYLLEVIKCDLQEVLAEFGQDFQWHELDVC